MEQQRRAPANADVNAKLSNGGTALMPAAAEAYIVQAGRIAAGRINPLAK